MTDHDADAPPTFPSSARSASSGPSACSVGSTRPARTEPEPDPPKRTLRLSTPEDYLAAASVVLGFVPAESLVQLVVSARGRAPHVRVDLPEPEGVDEQTVPLVAAARRYGVAEVALLVFSADPARGRTLAEGFARSYAVRGLPAQVVLWCTPERYFHPEGPPEGVAYHSADHPFVAETVLAGGVLLPGRRALAASLEPEAPAVLAEVIRSMPAPDARLDPAGTVEALHRLQETRGRWEPAEVAALIEALQRAEVREEVCSAATRHNARPMLEVATGLVRHAPSGLRAHPAAVAAFLGWLSGNGAMAWCAVDVSSADGGCELADVVAHCLEVAMSPDCWSPKSGSTRGVCA